MNQKKLYIIRHGETEYNRKGMVQGSGIDAPLNERGRAQAASFYEAYKGHSFDKLYISNLIRTYQSVEQFINDGLSFERLSGLNEISWGSQEGKPFTEEASRLYHQTVLDWTEGRLEKSVGGGESPLQVQQRQEAAIEYIMSKPSEKEVLICMHGRAMRILITWMTGLPLSRMEEVPHTNLGLYILETGSQGTTVVEENLTNHL